MSLLILLASKNGEVVTRGEILATLWPNMVVGDEVISQLIYSLRNALADDAKNPKYIETISKKGYRFIAEVSIAAPATIMSNNKNITNPINHSHNQQLNLNVNWLLAIGFIAALLFVMVWVLNIQNLPNNVNHFPIKNILPVTHDVGVESGFNFNESHKKMVYVSYQENRIELYLKALDKGSSQRFTYNQWNESSPLWLDPNTLLYIREQSGLFQIIRHGLDKDPEILYESNHAIFNLILKATNRTTVTFMEYDDYQHNKLHEMKLLSLITKKVSYLHNTAINLPSNIQAPIYSLNAQTLYFFNNTNKVKEIVALDVKSNQYSTITNQFSWVEHIALLDEDNLLISGELSATKGIWQLNILDGTIKSILPSSNGQRITRALYKQGGIYYSTYKTSSNQVIANLKQQTLETLPKLNSDANEYFGIYANNDQTIYFVSNRTGFYEIWSYHVDSKKTKQRTQLQASFIHKPLLSNTEEHFAVVYEKEALTLAIISLATGKVISQRKIPSMKYPLTWSKDDKSIYISEHKKHVDIYRYDIETLQPALVQLRAGLFAQESQNAETLLLIDYKQGGLISKNKLNGNTAVLRTAIDSLESLLPGELKVVKESMLAVEKEGPTRKIKAYSLTNKELNKPGTLLMNLPDWSRVTDFNTEGTKALFYQSSAPEGDIMRIQFSQ